EKKASEASEKAENALNESKETKNVLTVMSAIGSLKDIDAKTLQDVSNKIGVIINTLNTIYLGLSNCSNQFSNDIVKDSLRQLGVKLHTLTFYKFMNREQTDLVTVFGKSVSDKLNNDYDKTKFNEILAELKTLEKNLNT